jgi:hypothetical protein
MIRRIRSRKLEARSSSDGNTVLKSIFKKFNEFYDELYNNRELDMSDETYSYVKKFDELLKTCKPLILALVKARHEPFMSDRECAAIVKALMFYGLI